MKKSRRKLRWLVTIAAAVSAGLLLFSCLLFVYVDFGGRAGDMMPVWNSENGVISLALMRVTRPTPPDLTIDWYPAWPFLMVDTPVFYYNDIINIDFPMVWISVSLTIAASWMWIAPRQRQRRLNAGQCAKCGYDLSGLAGGVCPECGNTRAMGTTE